MMEQAKSIIISRIKDLQELNRWNEENTEKEKKNLRLSLAISQRNGETYRCEKESKILASQEMMGEIDDKTLNELGETIASIINAYEHEDIEIPTNQNEIYQRLKTFFSRHGFKQKINKLNILLNKKIDKTTCAIIISWLSEWSRHKYLTALHKGIQLYSIRSETSNNSHQMPMKRYGMRRQKSITQEIEKQPSKQLLIFSRATIYGCILQDMELYYKSFGCLDIDQDYLKTIKKKYKKQKLLEMKNLNKASQILVATKQNRQIYKNIKEYQQKYSIYKQKMESLKQLKKKESIRLATNNKYSLQKVQSLSKQKNKGDGSVFERLNFSKVRKVKSGVETTTKEHEQDIIRERILKLKSLQRQSNLKLPPLSRSYEKQCARWNQKSIIKFPTQSQCEMIENSEEGQIKMSGVHFSHRSSIKGIIIKNFISNREGPGSLKKHKQKSLLTEQNSLMLIGNNSSANINKYQLSNHHHTYGVHQNKHICGSVDLKSVRQKAKALLKNFKAIRNYQ